MKILFSNNIYEIIFMIYTALQIYFFLLGDEKCITPRGLLRGLLQSIIGLVGLQCHQSITSLIFFLSFLKRIQRWVRKSRNTTLLKENEIQSNMHVSSRRMIATISFFGVLHIQYKKIMKDEKHMGQVSCFDFYGDEQRRNNKKCEE